MKSNNITVGAIKEVRSFFMAIPALLWQILFLYIPLLFIIGISFLRSFDVTAIQTITIKNYQVLLQFSYVKIIARSLLLALFTAIFCFFISYPVAYFLALKVKKMKNLLLFFLALPFWTNFIVQVYAWFFILDRHGFLNKILLKLGVITGPLHILNTPVAIYIVMLFCYIPFMVMPLYTSLSKIDTYLLEASFDLGANPWQTFFNITFPLSTTGIKTGFFLVFIPSFGEFVIPALLGGSKTLYVGSMISYFFLETRNIFLGSAFTCVSMICLVCAALIIHLIFKKLFS